MEKAEKIEQYFAETHHFKAAITMLRQLVVKTTLDETFKWSFPTYTLEGKNVLAICKFKNHFGIWFFNGVFLSDPYGALQNAQKGKTQAMRHWKFFSESEVDTANVLEYINEAIENQRKELRLVPQKKGATEINIPKELKAAFSTNQTVHTAFQKLPPYSRKEYVDYNTNAKQAKTKRSRIEKILPMILIGKGLNEHYRKT